MPSLGISNTPRKSGTRKSGNSRFQVLGRLLAPVNRLVMHGCPCCERAPESRPVLGKFNADPPGQGPFDANGEHPFQHSQGPVRVGGGITANHRELGSLGRDAKVATAIALQFAHDLDQGSVVGDEDAFGPALSFGKHRNGVRNLGTRELRAGLACG